MKDDDDVGRVLSRLVEIHRDAERGFRTAADAVLDPAIKRLLLTYARQRAEFGGELEAELQRFGGTVPRSGSVGGALHRSWINLKAAVSGRDEAVVIAEAERGDDAALAAYEEALATTSLPPDVRCVVERQRVRVKEAHARLHDLRRAA